MKMLIVDDSKAMRMLVQMSVKQAGYKITSVAEAENGEVALNLIKSQSFDIIFSDWNMPVMTGIQFLTELNKLRLSKRPPFIFVTSESTTEMIGLAMDQSANGFITKPFTAERFKKELSELFKS